MWAWLVDRFETPYLLATLGALIGLAFGYFGSSLQSPRKRQPAESSLRFANG